MSSAVLNAKLMCQPKVPGLARVHSWDGPGHHWSQFVANGNRTLARDAQFESLTAHHMCRLEPRKEQTHVGDPCLPNQQSRVATSL